MPDLAVIFIKVVKNKGGEQLRVLNLCGKCLLGAAYSSFGSVFTCSSCCNPWQRLWNSSPLWDLPVLRIRGVSFSRLPVHQVRLPQEDGPQDGSSELLRGDPEAQTHPQGVQPPGVLPAHVSIPAPQHCSLESASIVTSRKGALTSPLWSLQRPRTVRMSCSVLLTEIFFLWLLVPMTCLISWISKEVLSWSRHLCSGHLEVI